MMSCHCYCVVCACEMCFHALFTMASIVTRAWVLVKVDTLGKEVAVNDIVSVYRGMKIKFSIEQIVQHSTTIWQHFGI